MRRLLPVLVLVALAIPVLADDMAAGYEAYDGGDYAAALAAWRRAAARGDTDAMTAIADLNLRGHGVPLDAVAAVAWYRRAAARGDAVAQLNLGDLLSRGIGAPRDAVAAHMWLALAAAQGRQWAADARDRLAATMTTDEITAARARRAAWRPRRP
jgi:localization factor PodJL